MQAPLEHTELAEPEVSGGYIEGVPPVPIPNTEVKPFRADGTARFPCGRVGRCRNIIETPRRSSSSRGASLFPEAWAAGHRTRAGNARVLFSRGKARWYRSRRPMDRHHCDRL